jgi:copper resistance protein C
MTRPHRGAAASLALALVALALVVLGSVGAPPASAHAGLAFSDPPAAGIVEALPSRATLTFTTEVSSVEEIRITGPEGSVTNGSPSFSGAEVTQNLWAGPDGEYEMFYEVVGADGHDVVGELTFEVAPLSTLEGDAPATAAAGAAESAEVEDAAPEAEGMGDRLRGVVVPGLLVVLAGAVVVLRRRRAPRAS